MVDFPRDEALMTAGLDAWPMATLQCPAGWKVTEERLQRRLQVTHFRLPPDYRAGGNAGGESTSPPDQHVPFVRFPLWHYCPACGKMERLALLQGPAPTYCREQACAQKKRRLIPVRIVAACEHGHMQDFPWHEWVHFGQVGADVPGHRLRYSAGQSASLSGIRISCSCGKSRTLAGAFSPNRSGGPLAGVGVTCHGERPWLGPRQDGDPHCGAELRVLQRGASNIYFPNIISAIHLPLWAEEATDRIVRTLEDPVVWDLLSNGLENGRISQDRVNTVAALRHLNADALMRAAQRKLEGIEVMPDESEEDFRRAEYEAIISARGGPQTDLQVEIVARERYQDWFSRLFVRVGLLHKLRETRVLAGFSRLLPPDGNNVQSLARDWQLGWLPAMVVRGEGIFIEFDEGQITDWIARQPDVSKRIAGINAAVNILRSQRGGNPIDLSVKQVLLHTFAHILIRQLSFDCGYGSASLRERIFCSDDKAGAPMQGILIYTASGDSEGTLGGLVRQGEPGRLEETLKRALQAAAWCSSDPVCVESRGQGSDNANLGACHSCTLVPETSCEHGNRYLDRGLICGIPGSRELGFFSEEL